VHSVVMSRDVFFGSEAFKLGARDYFRALAQGKTVKEPRPLDADQTISSRRSRSRNPISTGGFADARWNRGHKCHPGGQARGGRRGKAENPEN